MIILRKKLGRVSSNESMNSVLFPYPQYVLLQLGGGRDSPVQIDFSILLQNINCRGPSYRSLCCSILKAVNSFTCTAGLGQKEMSAEQNKIPDKEVLEFRK